MSDEPRERAQRPSTASSGEPARSDRAEIPTGGRLLLGWLLVLASIVLLSLGWYGVSGNPQVAVQLTYLASGGLGGLLAGIVGSALLLSNDMRRDRERLGRVEGAVLELREMLVAQSDVLRGLQAHPNGSSVTARDESVPAPAGDPVGEPAPASDAARP